MSLFLLNQAQEMVFEFGVQFKKARGFDVVDQATMLRFSEVHDAKNNTIKFLFDNQVVFQVEFSDDTLNAKIFKI